MDLSKELLRAKELIINSHRIVAFTGAGISVESGIPPFRGDDGLWSKYDPSFLMINTFYQEPFEAWVKIKEIFYDFFSKAAPNPAHYACAQMEKHNFLHCVITQNIDHLHHDAGSHNVIEYHGSSRQLICIECERKYDFESKWLNHLPPYCPHCSGILKPNFVFFGESIPIEAYRFSIEETRKADCWIIIGTSGEVQPANQLPFLAKQNGAKLIEINTQPSNISYISDVFLQGKASIVLPSLLNLLIS